MDKLYMLSVISAVVILPYIIWCFTEPFLLNIDKAVLRKTTAGASSNKEITIKKLPLTSDSCIENPDLRFFFFSDTHAEWCPVTSKRLCKAIRKAHGNTPLDAVIFGGDIVTHRSNAVLGYKYLSNISRCCKDLGIPFYGVSGNHDYSLDNAPESSGFISLDNTEFSMKSHNSGKNIILAGLSDSGRKNRIWQNKIPGNGPDPVILIAHDPDTIIHLEPGERPDFMLSGHLHGGQMKFPFRIEFTLLRKSDLLPQKGVVQGLYNINGTTVFISRGLGCGVLPFRFLSVPEATVTEIFI